MGYFEAVGSGGPGCGLGGIRAEGGKSGVKARYHHAMRAFEVRLNGKRLCVAGIDGDCVLNVIVNHVLGHGRNELWLTVGGLISATEEHVRWKVPHLKLGDKVALRIVETDLVDKPVERFRTDSKQDERNSKAYVRAVAKEYGWKLITRPRKSK